MSRNQSVHYKVDGKVSLFKLYDIKMTLIQIAVDSIRRVLNLRQQKNNTV